MSDEHFRVAAVFTGIRARHSRRLSAPMMARGVTVLLLFLAGHTPLWAGKTHEGNFAIFEFRCEFRMPPGPGRAAGLIASASRRQRIAIYWMEPAMFREAPSLLRCCDLILEGDVVHYWIQGLSRPGTLRLSDAANDPLLPAQKLPESVLRSALAIVGRIRSPGSEPSIPLEVGAFFEGSRGLAEYKYEVLAHEADGGTPFDRKDSGVHILNALPYGREYSKETQRDGAILWRAQKAANGPPVATVTVRRAYGPEQDAADDTFDEQTLGRWALIPEAYRAYWSFARPLETMGTSSDARTAARELYRKLGLYLDQDKVSGEVRRALDRLRFQAALRTADSNCVWEAAQAAVTGLCADKTVPKAQCVAELGSLSGRIQEQYPERMEDQLRPLVARVVRHGGRDAARSVDRLMTDIARNGWFTYGELFVAEMRCAGLVEERDAASWRARLEAARAAVGGATPDLSEEPPSVRQYLSKLRSAPAQGVVDLNDVRRILNEGLVKRYAPEQTEVRRELAESVIRLIRLLVGDGPFCGAPEKLIPALDRLSRNCLAVNKAPGSLDAILATFLALSFCDTSTPEDHERLFAQLRSCSHTLQSGVNARLAAHGLGALVTAAEVEQRFQVYERLFQRYLDDPLWPPFKFPWTCDEEHRLDGMLRLRLTELEPVFEEVSLKVRYGGASAELKDGIIRAISGVARGLLLRAASLRTTPYPGVSCRYDSGYGFSVVIAGPLYEEGGRPKEKFDAMKYFHLGHRLHEVVERERDLTSHPDKEEMGK
jgi:hypothetical protein